MEASEALEFAERLLLVLEHGRKSATYKYAVLLGLMDLCLTQNEKGAAPTSITTSQLAGRIVELYWPHARPFASPRAPTVERILWQNTRGQAEIVSLIRRFREKHAPDPSTPLVRARIADRAAFARLEREVEWKLVEMPLPKLQRLLSDDDAHGSFLYEIHWDDDIKRAAFLDRAKFDNRILLKPNVAEFLVRLSGILRPVIERRWAAMVMRLNDDILDDAHLDDFLFGVDRTALEPVRQPLLQLQGGDCFYCEKHIGGKNHVDHFVPWARHPTNALDNLVVAHEGCNLDKSDHLVASPHLRHWRSHIADHRTELDEIAETKSWEPPTGATLRVARAIYLRLPSTARLWTSGRMLIGADPAELARVLAA